MIVKDVKELKNKASNELNQLKLALVSMDEQIRDITVEFAKSKEGQTQKALKKDRRELKLMIKQRQFELSGINKVINMFENGLPDQDDLKSRNVVDFKKVARG